MIFFVTMLLMHIDSGYLQHTHTLAYLNKHLLCLIYVCARGKISSGIFMHTNINTQNNIKNNEANSIYACLSPAISTHTHMYSYIHDYIYPYSDRQKAEKIHNNANMRNRHTVNGIEENMWRRGGGADKKYDYTAQTGEQHTSVSLYLSLSLSVCVNICICVCGYSRGARTSERMTENMTTSAKKENVVIKLETSANFIGQQG